jgi:hypothetical protein
MAVNRRTTGGRKTNSRHRRVWTAVVIAAATFGGTASGATVQRAGNPKPTSGCATPVASAAVINRDGSIRWRVSLPRPNGPDGSTPLQDGARFFTNEGSELAAFSISSGKALWRFPVAGLVLNEWLIGRILVAEVDVEHARSQAWALVGLNAVNGHHLWTWSPGTVILGYPAPTGDGGLAVAFEGNKGVYPGVLNLGSGKLRWELPGARGSDVAYSAADGLFLWRSGDKLTAYDDRNGKARWSAPSVANSQPVTSGGAVLTTPYAWGRHAFPVTAYALKTGAALWAGAPFDVGALVPTAFGLLALSTSPVNTTKVALLDPRTGRALWHRTTPRPVMDDPWTTMAVVSGDQISVVEQGAGPSALVSWDAQTGAQSSLALPGEPQGFVSGPGQAVWVTGYGKNGTMVQKIVAGRVLFSTSFGKVQLAENSVVPLADQGAGIQLEGGFCFEAV